MLHIQAIKTYFTLNYFIRALISSIIFVLEDFLD